MQEDNKFTIEDFQVSDDRTQVSLNYSLAWRGSTHKYTENYVFPRALPDDTATQELLRDLHIACAISYYKSTMAPRIINPYRLSSTQIDFWDSVFTDGLGEFLRHNNLSVTTVASFISGAQEIVSKPNDLKVLEESAAIAISGGKDSTVGREILRKLAIPARGFVMSTGEALGQAKAMADKLDTDLEPIERHFDRSLLELQGLPGVFEGHIPVSVIFAFVGCLYARSVGSKYVVFANESSASIPQATHQGQAVNHQWSKSLEFEKLLQAYLASGNQEQPEYFSIIRPLSSVAVCKIFSNFPNYFDTFTSDNYVFRMEPGTRPSNGRWSLDSPKSLSSYILMSAWLDEDQLMHMFGHDFLADRRPENLNLFLDIMGLTDNPILDCVGTPEELRLSLALALQKRLSKDKYLVNAGIIQGLDLLTSSGLEEKLSTENYNAFPAGLSDRITASTKELLA